MGCCKSKKKIEDKVPTDRKHKRQTVHEINNLFKDTRKFERYSYSFYILNNE